MLVNDRGSSRRRELTVVKNKKIGEWIAAAFFVAAVSTGKPAAAVPLMVDFTHEAWLAVQGQSSYTRSYGAVDITLSTSGPLTFNAKDAPDTDSAVLALDGDGIGVRNDEISWGQRIDVHFSAPVTVLGYYFLDFFTGEGPGGIGELATVVFDTLSLVDEGIATDNVGFYERSVSVLTTSISFIAGLVQDANGGNYKFSDFALAGILIDDGTEPLARARPVAVPEPRTSALVALGLLGFALTRRGGRGCAARRVPAR